jgi:DNA (cytosine-5)-methyltransferase 1
MHNKQEKNFKGRYIDLFSGCGGLSLGLGKAGWEGVFAVEKDPMAFQTFKHNLIDGKYNHFSWPDWLPQKATTIQTLLKNNKEHIKSLRGTIDLIAGGPPCQGFSLAGRRNPNDPRNQLSNEYLKMVDIVRPKYILLENVKGFNAIFKDTETNKGKVPYSEIVAKKLEKLGYKVFKDIVNSKDYGVPQQRVRFIMVGIRKDVLDPNIDPFTSLSLLKKDFLKNKKLPLTPVSVKDALSDLEFTGSNLIYHSGSPESGFKKLDYIPPNKYSAYQKLMRKGLRKNKPNALRIARHKPTTIERFKLIQSICRPGVTLNDAEREAIGTKKQVITVLNPDAPSKTLTTLPDDILHYSEPRILTVRENARIQSFPDDFDFRGKYTTGGMRRTQECPRYTQVGNAVPPLMAEALGTLILHIKDASNV